MIRWLGLKPERGVLYNQAARVCHRVRQQEGGAPVSVREEEKGRHVRFDRLQSSTQD